MAAFLDPQTNIRLEDQDKKDARKLLKNLHTIRRGSGLNSTEQAEIMSILRNFLLTTSIIKNILINSILS